MAALNLRPFTSPENLRGITPIYLSRLLEPHRSYFDARGLRLPAEESREEPDYELLAEILATPDKDTPPSLIDALFFVTELATHDGMDSLLDELLAHGHRPRRRRSRQRRRRPSTTSCAWSSRASAPSAMALMSALWT